ncbi:MAG: TrmH family RNA methyltransferase [Myxococcota bacterium]
MRARLVVAMNAKRNDNRTNRAGGGAPPAEAGPVVDSLQHPLAIEIRALLHRSGRAETQRMLIDDEENILEAIEAGIELVSVFHAGEGGMPERVQAALPERVGVHEVARRTAKKLFGAEKSSRLFAIARTPPPLELSALERSPRDIVVLDDVGIMGNIGAIIRTSLALFAGGLVLLDFDPVDIYDRRLIRASRGYVFSLPVVTATTAQFLEYCQGREIPLLVTAIEASSSIPEISARTDRLAIAFGSEKRGCSAELTAGANIQVRIPMDPRVESLNVSATAGIMLHSRLGFNRGEAPG